MSGPLGGLNIESDDTFAWADDPDLAADLAARQREYSYYVANQPIRVGTALAYAVGHPVPISNVISQRYLQRGLVDLVAHQGQHPPEVLAAFSASPAPIVPPAPPVLVDASGEDD